LRERFVRGAREHQAVSLPDRADARFLPQAEEERVDGERRAGLAQYACLAQHGALLLSQLVLQVVKIVGLDSIGRRLDHTLHFARGEEVELVHHVALRAQLLAHLEVLRLEHVAHLREEALVELQHFRAADEHAHVHALEDFALE